MNLPRCRWSLCVAAALTLSAAAPCGAADPEPLPGTKPLTLEGDIASYLVDGVDKFLLRELAKSVERRARYWKRDFSSPEAYNKSIEPNRKRLAHILGVRDPRESFDAPQLVATVGQKEPGLAGKGNGYNIYAVRWPVLADPDHYRNTPIIHGEGLLLVPNGGKPVADVVAIPHCDHTPEQIVGLAEGMPAASQYARRLAESGCRVIVPTLISRTERYPTLTHREWLYRSAFELGRHLIGYEVQKVLACVDWFERQRKGAGDEHTHRKIGVIGYGEGGMIALYAAALDTRIDAACVSGYFAPREDLWQQPIDRNVFGLLEQFGDAELASMVAPRQLIIEYAPTPAIVIPGGRGAPSRIASVPEKAHELEVERAAKLGEGPAFRASQWLNVRFRDDKGRGKPGMERVLHTLMRKLVDSGAIHALGSAPASTATRVDSAVRHARQVQEIDRFNQLLLRDSQVTRRKFMQKLYDAAKSGIAGVAQREAAYNRVAAEYREIFYRDVIGRFDYDLLPPNPRSRKLYEKDGLIAYEVVLEVFPDVIAYGIVTLPKGMKAGEKRPVVVCQHGLEGRPQSVIGKEQYQYYKAFATELAKRGFITFAPQNLYIFHDRFRTLQRKANPLGKTLFSIITPQHQQIINWLKTLPQVDGKRIGFYGLSYGGKTAMRVPALITDYALSICSADFNEWVWKNAATSSFADRYTYSNKGEYEIFEFDLGGTFNYAEMAALIAPRPFMVERGHFDGVAPDQTVAYEYAKIRHLYAAGLGLPDRTAIEWFVGPHSINGKGTFDFLHKHLNWPKP